MSDIKLTILFAPLSIFISHVTRCLCVAEGLKKRGHNIEFLSSGKYMDFISESGYKVHKVSEVNFAKNVIHGAPDLFYKKYKVNREKGKYGFYEMIRDDIAVIKKIKPQLIIFDGRFAIQYLAHCYEIPCIEIRNYIGFVYKDAEKFLQGYDNFEMSRKDDKELTDEFREAFYSHIPQYDMNIPICKKKKLFPVPIIVPGVKEFEVDKVNYFQHTPHIFTGSLIWSNWKKKYPLNEDLLKNKEIVLIAVGSSFPCEKAIETISNALMDINDNFYLIINCSLNFKIKLKLRKENYQISEYISYEETLKYVNLVFHHGGHGTTMQVLKAGLPAIVIPFNGDQIEISQQIEKLKLGVVIKKYPDDILESDVKNAVNEIQNNHVYDVKAKKMSDTIKSYTNSTERAADFIEKYYFNYIN